MVEITQAIINGICTGFGTAIGSYAATSYAIKHMNDLMEKLRNNGKKDTEEIITTIKEELT